MKKPVLFLILMYLGAIALIATAAFVIFSITGCGEIPQTQQTVTKTKLIRLVQVDKDGKKTNSEIKRVKIKQ